MIYLFILLLVAHLICDFFLQTDSSCKSRDRNGLKGREIYIHSLCVFLLSWLASLSLYFWLPAFIIAVLHLFTDALKVYIGKKTGAKCEMLLFFCDQFVHIIVLLVIAWIWTVCFSCYPTCLTIVASCLEIRNLCLICSVLVCLKPANIVIKIILKHYSVDGSVSNSEKNNFRSGALIGNLERLLILAFVVLSQYEAIGFLIAAKSILRFNEIKESEKSEYVLAGTLISLLIAFSCGMIVNLFS